MTEPPSTKGEPSKAVMVKWSAERRSDKIQQIYVRHSAIKDITTALELHWQYGLRRRESTTAFLVGESRCGKTETIKRFIGSKIGKEVPHTLPDPFTIHEGNGVKVAFLDTTNGATPLQVTKHIVSATYQHHFRFSEEEASAMLLRYFGDDDIDLFVIDEGQKMAGNGMGNAARKFADWLLSLENARKFRILVAGGPALKLFIDNNETVRDRKDSLAKIEPFPHLTPEDKAAFRTFLVKFDNGMPFLTTPLSDKGLQDAFYFACRGRPGKLAKLVDKAAQVAFMEPEPPLHLTVEHLARGFDIQLGHDHQMQGYNPFRDKELPTIPLNLEQERLFGFDPEDEPPTRPRRQKGSRIARPPR